MVGWGCVENGTRGKGEGLTRTEEEQSALPRHKMTYGEIDGVVTGLRTRRGEEGAVSKNERGMAPS